MGPNMRFTAVFSLGFASLICSAALTEGASAQSNPYALDRLFLDPDQIPFNDVLSFNSETAVENYFGLGSREASLASDFFAGYTGDSANMLFARFVPGGGRARIYGGNLSGLSQAQLQAINGTLSLTSEGYNFNASVNLASATSLASAAYQIQTAVNAVQPTVATITGSSIAPGSASFKGSIETGVMDVTSVSAGTIAIGGILTGVSGFSPHVIAQVSGTPGGVGVYDVWQTPNAVAPGTALSESYGTLTVGKVTSGVVSAGQEVAGGGVLPNTAIYANVSGSQWIVDLTQTASPDTMVTRAAPLEVNDHPVTGATGNANSLWIEVNWDDPVLPSTMTYASGSAAAALGLTRSAGATLSTPGEIVSHPYEWMNDTVIPAIEQENAGFATFQTVESATSSEISNDLEAWANASGGEYSYLYGWGLSTPPIVDSIPSGGQMLIRSDAAVPEASSWLLLLLGFVGLGLAGRVSAAACVSKPGSK